MLNNSSDDRKLEQLNNILMNFENDIDIKKKEM